MKILRLAILAAGIALGVVAYRVQMHNLDITLFRALGIPWNETQAEAMVSGPYTTSARSWAIVIGAWLFLAAGLVAWSRRPANQLGLLMTAAGLALLLRQLRYSHDDFLFTTFFVVGELSYWVVAQAVFAYPYGRITDRFERALIKVGYAVTFLFSLAVLLVYDGSERLRFFDPVPRDSLINVVDEGHLAVTLQKAFVIVVWGVLAGAAIALIVRKLVRATPRARRILAPLLLAAITVALRAVFESVFTFIERPSEILYEYIFWWQISAFIALPVALLAGFLRARLARASVGDLVLELERTPPQGIRDALARALDDPTLQVLFWLPERGVFVDPAGRSVDLPVDGHGVTRLEHEGETLAALVHDPSLVEEPKLVQAAGAAATLALENARLHAETRAQLEEVRDSRIRIVAAADEERRRIERDIHDGAQQRLVALAVQLRNAQRRLADPEVDRLLTATVSELQVAVEELRELARGVHPAILTEDGLAAALESLVSRTPFPITLETDVERLATQIEATAYFVACESLVNVAKHADASTVKVSAHRRNGLLVVEVEDDGVGGASAEIGSGLRGLADRVEALGGRFRVDSPAGNGTRVVAEIPCAS